MTSNLIKFIETNPSDPRVVRIMKLANKPLSLNGKLGRLMGELSRELEG